MELSHLEGDTAPFFILIYFVKTWRKGMAAANSSVRDMRREIRQQALINQNRFDLLS
jgi:hypothetical protein